MGRCIWSRKKVDATTIVGAVSKFYPRAAGKLAAPLAKEGLPSATTAECDVVGIAGIELGKGFCSQYRSATIEPPGSIVRIITMQYCCNRNMGH